jgi:hypothetical protein
MSAADLEAVYQELRFGRTESVCLYLDGSTLKSVSKYLEHPVDETTDGKPILDGELYMVSEIGTWRIE